VTVARALGLLWVESYHYDLEARLGDETVAKASRRA